MDEKFQKLIEALAAKLGTTAEHLWGVLVRQAPISGAVDLVLCVMSQPDPVTFGRYIADARKKLQMSQKELASQILREEDDEPISPQYLNDIERDRRNPSSDHLIQQFAKVLKIDADYLSYLAGKLPEEIRRKNLSEDAVKAAFLAFRKPQKK